MNIGLDFAESSEILLTKKKCSILPSVCCGWYVPQRYILAICLFMGLSTHYIILESSTVVFRENTAHANQTEEFIYPCPAVGHGFHFHNEREITKIERKISEIELKLSSTIFVIGYILSQVPSIILAQKYGGKLMFIGSVVIGSTLHMMLPMVINMKKPGFTIAWRALEGISMAPLFNIALQLLVRWSPEKEVSTLASIAFSGLVFGNAVGTSFSVLIMEYYGTWSSCFYFFGALSYVWVVTFCVMCFTEPNEHPYITSKELKLIQSSYGGYVSINQATKGVHYWKIIKTGYLWLLALIYSLQLIQFRMLLDVMNQYLLRFEGLDRHNGGILKGLMAVCMTISGIIFGIVSDVLMSKKLVNKMNARRIGFFVSVTSPMILIMPCLFVECQLINCLIWLFLSCIATGSMNVLKIHIIDIAPNSAGTTFAMIHIVGMLSFMTISIGLTDHEDYYLPRSAFRMLAGLNLIAGIVLGSILLKYCTVKQMAFDKIENSQQRVRNYPARY